MGGVAQVEAEELPAGTSIIELQEILGERCCKPLGLTPKQRRSGPRSAYWQQFLVRGSFLEDDGSSDEDDNEALPLPSTYWMDQDDLLRDIALEDVEEALQLRQERVKGDLRPKKKGRRS